MDRGIHAAWYDLPEGGREEYLAWFHGEYLPETLRRPGHLWAAHFEVTGGGGRMKDVQSQLTHTAEAGLGTGTQYIALLGAASPHVFCAPAGEEESAEARGMLGRRTGERICIFSEEARVDGPEAASRAPGLTPGPAIQMGSFVAQSVEAEFDLSAWYARYRLPAMARMPGCVGARKLLSVAGWAKHSILYEFTSLEAREENFQGQEDQSLDEKSWTGRVIRYVTHAPGSPSVGRRIWPEP